MYDGDRAFAAAQLPPADELYVEGIKNWRKVLDKYPDLLKDSNLTDDLMESINHYQTILHQLNEKMPEPFLLQDVIDADKAFHTYATTPSQTPAGGEAGAAANDPNNPSK